MEHPQSNELILRQYLLGALPEDEQQLLEEQLLSDHPLVDQLTATEAGLFEEYLENTLSTEERERFEDYFLSTPQRVKQLRITKALYRYAARNPVKPPKTVRAETPMESVIPSGPDPPAPPAPPEGFIERVKELIEKMLRQPVLVPATAFLLLAILSLGTWQMMSRKSDTQPGAGSNDLAALKQGLDLLRTIPPPQGVRISRFTSAPLPSPTPDDAVRGLSPGPPDTGIAISQSPELAEKLSKAETNLKFANISHPGPEISHALGQLYLVQGDYQPAIAEFEKALATNPTETKFRARLNSDLGAAHLALGIKIRRETEEKLKDKPLPTTPPPQGGESTIALAKSLTALDAALALDDSLLEALFNRALCHTYLFLPQQAQQAEEDWNRYLQKDPNSPWADAARNYLKELEDKKKKAARTPEDLFNDFILAYQSRDGTKAKEVISQSRLRTGHLIADPLIDSYLDASLKGQIAIAEDCFQKLSYVGELEAEFGDLFVSDLMRFYKSITLQQLEKLSLARKDMKAGIRLYFEVNIKGAIEKFCSARMVFEGIGDTPDIKLVEFYTGHCYLFEDIEQSKVIFNRLISQSQKTKYKRLLAESIYGIASIRYTNNEYSEAIKSKRLAFEFLKDLKDANGITYLLVSLSDSYRNIGKYPISLGFIELASIQTSDYQLDEKTISRIYTGAALNFTQLGHREAALHFCREVLHLTTKSQRPFYINRAYAQAGVAYGEMRNYEEGIKHISMAYETGKQLNNDAGREMVAYASLHLGDLYFKRGDPSQALSHYKEAVGLYDLSRFPFFRYSAQKGVALTYLTQKNDNAAEKEIEKTLNLFEQYRQKIKEESNRNSFFDNEHDIYDIVINFQHLRKNNFDRALEYSEISRSRSLLDSMNIRAQVIENGNEKDLHFSSISQPLGLSDIQTKLHDDVQIIQYSAQQDKLLIWLINKKEIVTHAENIGLKALNEKVTGYLQTISRKKDEDLEKIKGNARELYTYLIKPIESHLERSKEICIVPDKILHHLPFASLISDNLAGYLLENFVLTYAPSSSIFIKCSEIAVDKATGNTESIFGVGNPRFDNRDFPNLPDLPTAASEVRLISKLYKRRRVLTETAATESRVRTGMEWADVIHFATHTVINPQAPARSSLALAPESNSSTKAQEFDGRLQAGEIYELQFPRTRLVVLSACQTGVERTYRGEGSVSVARPFIAKKVPLVVASYWAISSNFAEKLMVSFHQYRTGSKGRRLSTAEALKQAQMDMLHSQDKRYRHPYYWASFMTIGGHANY